MKFNFSYDATNQLTAVDASGDACGATGCDESFAFDLNGNRTTSTGSSGSQTYTTAADNRLSSDSLFNYAYGQ